MRKTDYVQTSLFSKTYDFLNIVRDGQKVKMRVAQIFNPEDYEELYAVTFISSPEFFFKTAKSFSKVRLILGIEDSERLDQFGSCLKKWLDPEEQAGFWKSINEEIREKIRKRSIVVRFPRPNYPIHSKFYLLKGPDKSRVVIGSANFTRTAFQDSNQFEELLIFDNSPLFDLYMARFQELEDVTLDYISDRLKRSKPEEVILLNDPEVLKDITLFNLDKIGTVAITEEQMEQIKERSNIAENECSKESVFCKVVELVTRKQRKDDNFKISVSSNSKAKIADNLKVIVSSTRKGSLECDNRIELYYCDGNNLLIYPEKPGENTRLLVPFSKQATVESIRRNLLAINDFVESYEKYTYQKDLKACTRVFEIILYSFLGPYIWKMQEHNATQFGRDSVRANFPSFLFVYGVSKAGKTTLFEALERLLGNNAQPMSYEFVNKYLSDYFYSENLMPLLVDEVPENFMTSKAQKLGERLIKTVSNDLKGKHPVMIGASNSDRFSIPPQVQRRVYFIKVSNTFEQTEESQSHLSRIMSQIDSALFRDFTWKMAKRITEGGEFYKAFDPLAAGREIFKEYYSECGIPVPSWFPSAPVNDYGERGAAYWRHVYKTKRNAFKETAKGKLIVELDEIVTRQDRDFVTNLLPPECLEDRLANKLELKKEAFLKFIGESMTVWQDRIKSFFIKKPETNR